VSVLRATALAAASMLAACTQAWGCGEALRGTTSRIENAHYEIAFAVVPEPIAAGKHFALDIAVCPRAGAEAPKALQVDAAMPEHRHGMNYRPVVASRGPGRYRADGLMFHMPGRWDLYFDVATSAGSERLTATRHIE
jgi:hypothetical protein